MHFVDFEISREKGDFLKTTIEHLGLNRGRNKYHHFMDHFRPKKILKFIRN